MSTNASAFDATAAFNAYFGFNRKPFPTRFDADFFCANPRYEIIYSQLLEWIRHSQGLMALTGEAGAGKTFMLRKLMLDAKEDVTFVFYNYFTDLDFDDLLGIVCENLDLPTSGLNRSDKLKALFGFLNTGVETGQSVALIIDEAHKLNPDVLSHLFTLASSDFNDGRSLQILLSGLPLLGETLTSSTTILPTMADISERRLEPFTDADVAAFIRQQVKIAGGPNEDLFPETVLKRIAHHARVPRLISMFCDRALRIAQEEKTSRVSPEMINIIADEILPSHSKRHTSPSPEYDVFPHAPPPASKPIHPYDGTFIQADMRSIPSTNRALIPITLSKPAVTDKTACQLVVLPHEKPEPGIDGLNQHSRRRRNWAALVLLVSLGVAGSYALRQNDGFDTPVVEGNRTLAAGKAEEPSLASGVASMAHTPTSENSLASPTDFADLASIELTPEAGLPMLDFSLDPDLAVDINFLPPSAPAERSEPVTPQKLTAPQSKVRAEIERLLALAEASRLDYRLTTPAHDSAVYYYRKVLQLDSNNRDARRGFSKVITAYWDLARANLRRNEYRRARMFIERGLALAPNNRRLLALQEQVRRETRSRSANSFSRRRYNYGYSYSGEQGFNRK